VEYQNILMTEIKMQIGATLSKRIEMERRSGPPERSEKELVN
jgi:hypothetical protein